MSNIEFREEDVTITVTCPAIPHPEFHMRVVHVPSGVMVEGKGRSRHMMRNELLSKLRQQWEALQQNTKPTVELDRATVFSVREVFGMLKTEIDKAEQASGEWRLDVERAEAISDSAAALASLLSRQVHNRMKA